jgi:hypothetical protein
MMQHAVSKCGFRIQDVNFRKAVSECQFHYSDNDAGGGDSQGE